MIITTKQFLSSLWLVIALIVASLLAVALPRTLHAQTTADASIQVEGYASWYNLGLHGAKTASGERYDHKALTAAHASLPFNTMVKVTNLENNTFVVVRINDRMKSGAKHIIDLSGAAAEKIGLFKSGTAEVKLSPVDAQSIAENTEQRAAQVSSKPIEMGPVAPRNESSTSRQESRIQTVSSKNTGSNGVKGDSGEGMYTLQIGSFSTHDRASVLADKFKEAWIARIEVNGEVSFRVYFSRFEQEKPARIAQNDLWTKGQDSFLRKVAS